MTGAADKKEKKRQFELKGTSDIDRDVNYVPDMDHLEDESEEEMDMMNTSKLVFLHFEYLFYTFKYMKF